VPGQRRICSRRARGSRGRLDLPACVGQLPQQQPGVRARRSGLADFQQRAQRIVQLDRSVRKPHCVAWIDRPRCLSEVRLDHRLAKEVLAAREQRVRHLVATQATIVQLVEALDMTQDAQCLRNLACMIAVIELCDLREDPLGVVEAALDVVDVGELDPHQRVNLSLFANGWSSVPELAIDPSGCSDVTDLA